MAEALRRAVVDHGRRGLHLHASTVNIDCGAGRRGVRVVAWVRGWEGEGGVSQLLPRAGHAG